MLSILRRATLCGVAFFFTCVQTSAAEVTPVVARIDGKPVSMLSVDALWRLARQKDAKVERAQILDDIVQNRLLAVRARKRFSETELHPGQKVAFVRDVMLDDKVAAQLRVAYDVELTAALHALPGAKLDGLILATERPAAAQLDAIFGSQDKLRLDYTLNAEHEALAKPVNLLRFAFAPGAIQTISLYDVYRRQNVQGRVELFRRNTDFMQQQAKLALANMFTVDWATRKFGAEAVMDLRQTLADQDDVRAFRELHGIGDDTDSESPLLKRLAGEVSAEQIADYYRAHRSEFTRIDKVKARHIRIEDEALARRVSAAAAKGDDFAALAKRYSSAADAQNGGDLGWIVHKDKADWLAQLAFIQPTGHASPPFRTPVGPKEKANWEILLVEQQVTSYQAKDSETVRYLASQAIARETAYKQFNALRSEVVRKAKIEIDRKILDQATTAGKA